MKNLLDYSDNEIDQKPIYKAELHWVTYIIPVIFILLGLLSIPAAIIVFLNRDTAPILFKVGMVLLLYLPYKGIYSILLNKRIRIALFEKQITVKSGLFTHNVSDIPLNKYEGLKLHQSFWGKILGYGNLYITTGGVSQGYSISEPLELRKHINNQLNK